MHRGYTDESGEPMGYVLRMETATGKTYRPVSKCPDGWRCKAMPAPRPLYRLTYLPDADQVFVTEGEKAADALAELGLVATTSAGGSHAAKQADWTPLAGKQVVIFPDNDEPGRGYAEDVAELLRALAPRPTVRFMDTGPAGLNLPDKGDDAVEYIERLQGDGLDAASIRADLEGRLPDLRMDDSEAPTRPGMIPNWRPFPVDVLPDTVADYVKEGAEGIDCAPALIALPMLSAIAAAIGTTRKIDVNGQWSEWPILWTCLVAESGAAKTPARDWALRAVEKRDARAAKDNKAAQDEHDLEMLEYDRALKRWRNASKSADTPMPEKPAPPIRLEYKVDDVTVEAVAGILQDNRRGILVAPDELAKWFQSHNQYKSRGGSDMSKWLELHGGGTLKINRKGDGVTLVTNAAASITGGIQPGVLRGLLGKQERDSGLAARFLFAYPPRKAKRVKPVTDRPELARRIVGMFDRLYSLEHAVDLSADDGACPVVLKQSPCAQRACLDFMNAHNAEGMNHTGHEAAAWSKLEAYGARLALIVHLARWACGESGAALDCVDLQSVEAGIALAEWFRYEMLRVYAILDEDDAEAQRRGLVDQIAKLQADDKKATARNIMQGCKRFKRAADVEKAFDDLAARGYGSIVHVKSGSKGGRPTHYFKLLPVADGSAPRLHNPSATACAPTLCEQSPRSADVLADV